MQINSFIQIGPRFPMLSQWRSHGYTV